MSLDSKRMKSHAVLGGWSGGLLAPKGIVYEYSEGFEIELPHPISRITESGSGL